MFASAPGIPISASVDDICQLLLARAVGQRAKHWDGEFDDTMAAIVDRYGETAVQEVVQLVLVNRVPFRTAAANLEMRNIDGVRIRTTAGWFLEELNTQGDD